MEQMKNDAANKIARTVENACNVDCRAIRPNQARQLPDCAFCRLCSAEQYRTGRARKCEGIVNYAYYQSEKWGGKYEFLCPAGCAFIAVLLRQNDEDGIAMLTGPFLMVELDDFCENDLSVLFQAEPSSEVVRAAAALPFIECRRVPYITDMMFMLCGYVSGREIIDLQVMEYSAKSQSEVFSAIEKIKEDGRTDYIYPIEMEGRLRSYIAHGDRTGAQNTLNEILGHIYFSAGADFAALKARVVELLVLLSRAAIEGGASVSEVFGINSDYIDKVLSFDSVDRLNYWLAHALVRYTATVFPQSDTRHGDILKKVMRYIHNNCAEKLTLNEIADHVNYSVSYLSRIFKEETGESVTAYVNRVRIERAKALLANDALTLTEIASLSGFEDQSYFNKVFKRVYGETPGRFRAKLSGGGYHHGS